MSLQTYLQLGNGYSLFTTILVEVGFLNRLEPKFNNLVTILALLLLGQQLTFKMKN